MFPPKNPILGPALLLPTLLHVYAPDQHAKAKDTASTLERFSFNTVQVCTPKFSHGFTWKANTQAQDPVLFFSLPLSPSPLLKEYWRSSKFPQALHKIKNSSGQPIFYVFFCVLFFLPISNTGTKMCTHNPASLARSVPFIEARCAACAFRAARS